MESALLLFTGTSFGGLQPPRFGTVGMLKARNSHHKCFVMCHCQGFGAIGWLPCVRMSRDWTHTQTNRVDCGGMRCSLTESKWTKQKHKTLHFGLILYGGEAFTILQWSASARFNWCFLIAFFILVVIFHFNYINLFVLVFHALHIGNASRGVRLFARGLARSLFRRRAFIIHLRSDWSDALSLHFDETSKWIRTREAVWWIYVIVMCKRRRVNSVWINFNVG